MNKLKLIMARTAFGIVLLAGAMSSCSEYTEGVNLKVMELGARQDTVILGANAGHTLLNILSNQSVQLSFLEPGEWVYLSKTAFSGDSDITVDYDDNEGFPRQTRILVEAVGQNVYDTVTLQQRGGITPRLALAEGTLLIQGSAPGTSSTPLDTNIDFQQMDVEISYTLGGEDWITGVGYGDGNLSVDYLSNPDETLRTGNIVLRWLDAWNATHTVTLNVMQMTKDDELGQYVEFDHVRDMIYPDEEISVEDFVIVTGRVVSEKTSRNAGDNPMLTETTIDYTVCDKTVYLQSLDGRYGFMITTATIADNIFERYDRVELLLYGATLTERSDPERYEISGISSSMVVSRQAGTASSLPEKKMYIGELTDADIYTFVTLRDCEFPVRKGSIAPLHEGYTLADAQGRINKYPRLMRDINGASIYLYTNTTCPYRRTGAKLPYGSGEISGVVVKELFPQYVYGDAAEEENMGNIGDYQLRHMAYEDIKFHDTDSFSTILTEYRYIYNKEASVPYSWKPTYGSNGRFWHTCTRHATSGATGSTYGAYAPTTWNYLGPVGTARGTAPFNNNIGSIAGLGIILEDQTDYLYADSRFNTDGKGGDGATNAWANVNWWDDSVGEEGEPYAWMVEFSTMDITDPDAVVSMQISIQSGRALGNCSPLYWTAEWATSETAAEWETIGDYTLPEYPIYNTQKMWQLPGYKQIDFRLPQQVIGQPRVIIRMRPTSPVANTDLEFAAGRVNGTTNNDSGSAMDYFAIRYNSKP